MLLIMIHPCYPGGWCGSAEVPLLYSAAGGFHLHRDLNPLPRLQPDDKYGQQVRHSDRELVHMLSRR